MKRTSLFIAALALTAIPLSSCATYPTSPAAIADQTTIDERTGTAINLAYTAAAKAETFAIRYGVVKDQATIKRIGDADNKAYAAVQAVNAAYSAANSASYDAAVTNAYAAVASFNAAIPAQ